ncbi:MAG: hypothetical protein ACRDQ0_18605 [Pseudonocardia sp.]
MALPVAGLHGAHLRADLVRRLGRARVENAVAAGEVRPLWRGVVVDSRRLLDPLTRAAAALLTAGPRSVITGVTAAALHGCRAVESPVTHILVPYGCETRSRKGLVVHHARPFADDVIELDGLRALPLDRVIADLLCTLPEADALAVADEALRVAGGDRGTFRKEVAERLRTREDNRGTVRAAGLLDLVSDGVDSPAESWLRLKVIDKGFPVPEVNWVIPRPDGTVLYRLDLAWPRLRIALEYDGVEAHSGREAHDEARRADLGARGWIVVVARSEDLRSFSRVAGELRAAFARRGYTW